MLFRSEPAHALFPAPKEGPELEEPIPELQNALNDQPEPADQHEPQNGMEP